MAPCTLSTFELNYTQNLFVKHTKFITSKYWLVQFWNYFSSTINVPGWLYLVVVTLRLSVRSCLLAFSLHTIITTLVKYALKLKLDAISVQMMHETFRGPRRFSPLEALPCVMLHVPVLRGIVSVYRAVQTPIGSAVADSATSFDHVFPTGRLRNHLDFNRGLWWCGRPHCRGFSLRSKRDRSVRRIPLVHFRGVPFFRMFAMFRTFSRVTQFTQIDQSEHDCNLRCEIHGFLCSACLCLGRKAEVFSRESIWIKSKLWFVRSAIQFLLRSAPMYAECNQVPNLSAVDDCPLNSPGNMRLK